MLATLAFGLVNWLVMAERPSLALGVLLCFAGLLRASEALQLLAKNFGHRGLFRGSSELDKARRDAKGLH